MAVIPTLLLVGFVFGRWWRIVIPVAAVGWALLLITTEVGSGLGFAVNAAVLGAVNLAVGVFLYQGLRYSLRTVWHRQGVSQ